MYPKIETYFNRGPDFKVDTDRPRVHEFTCIENWAVTEKCDGMNIQVHMMDPGFGLIEGAEEITRQVIIQGRTPNAQFRPAWMDFLKSIFTPEKAESLFRGPLHPGNKVTLFGELLGPKINGNPHGLDELEFRGFDVLVDETWWLDKNRVDQILYHFLTKGAPWMGYRPIYQIVSHLKAGTFVSQISKNGYFEGVVCRPAHELRVQDRSLSRIIWKLKTRDFKCST